MEIFLVFKYACFPYGHNKYSLDADICSCMRLHKRDRKFRKGAWKAQSERHWHRIILNVEKFFSASSFAQAEVLVIDTAGDPVPRTTRECTKMFLTYDGKRRISL